MAENQKETLDAVEETKPTADSVDDAATKAPNAEGTVDTTETTDTNDDAVLEAPEAEEAADSIETTDTEAADSAKEENDASEKDDSALESFLSREQEEKKTPKKSSSRKPLFILIGAIAAVAILVTLLIVLRSHPPTVKEETVEADLSLAVSTDGVHEANVTLDDNGNILKNGQGSLLTYVPSSIKTIDVENENGSFSVTADTPSGEATVYKIVGFENYNLQEGVADEIANHCSEINFTRVIEVNADLADFGLENPRATVNVAYTDDTKTIIRVGAEAAGEAGTYVAFGTSKDVYLMNNEDVSSFLYNVNEFISLAITDTNEDSETSEFSKATITGTHFDDAIVLEPNKDEALDASYLLTEPIAMPANAIEASDIAGNIRGLYAEAVKCVNPSEDQLSDYGLSKPYAEIRAVYPDTEITLQCSEPSKDGSVYIYNPDKNVIYTIQLAAVSWAKTSVDLLMPENPMNAKLKCVDEISFKAGDTDFTLDVTTKTETVTDDNGNEQESSTSTASCNGKDLKSDDFNVFYQNITAIKNLGASDANGKDKVMTLTLSYTTDRSPDTLTVYTGSDGSKYIMEYNGKTIGTVSKAYINSLIEGAENLIAGNPVEGL